MSDASVLDTAREAFSRWSHGLATGDWESYLEMLADDFTFELPLGEFRGRNFGKERAADYHRRLLDDVMRTRIRVEEPRRVTVGNGTVVFEVEDVGTIAGQPYRGRVAVSFDVRGKHISGFREYYGDIDPSVVSAISTPR